jgi:hypothetical protein
MRGSITSCLFAPLVASLFCGTVAEARAQEAEAKPLLKPADRDSLAALFADYFRHKKENKDLKKLLAAFDKLDEDMKKKAKTLKLATLFESPADLRVAMCAPIYPEKNAKRGMFAEASLREDLATGVVEMKYFYRLPKNYSDKQIYPLILGLPPKLEKADAIKKWAEAAYPEAIAESVIVIVPQNLRAVDWTSFDGRLTALFPVRQAFGSFGVDRGRLFVDGQADAAPVVIDYITHYPSLFTAGILRESASAPQTNILANGRYVPLLLLNGPEGEAAKIHAQFAQDCTAAGVKVTSVESPVEAGGKAGEAGVAAIAKFVAEARKTFAPRDIKFTSESNQSLGSYWLELTRVESNNKPVTVEATVDRTTNEFRLSVPPQVKEVALYLNHDLVDMGKEIKVIVTEKVAENPKTSTRFAKRVDHSFEDALRIWFDGLSGNSGEVYSARIVVTMP